MAKERTKVNKKSNGKVRRRARKTIASLLLVSAIVVAAIPVPDTVAAATDPDKTNANFTFEKHDTLDASIFPIPTASDPIFCNETGEFQYVYIKQPPENNRNVAVLVGFAYQSLPNGHLTIPSKLDAYTQYTITLGTGNGYVASTLNGEFLYYREVTKYTKTPVKDDLGIITSYNIENEEPYVYLSGGQSLSSTTDSASGVETYYTYRYIPCMNTTRDIWEIDNARYYKNVDASLVNQYVDTNQVYNVDSTGNVTPSDSSFSDGERLVDAEVAYISSKHLETDINGKWVVADKNEKKAGVFAGNGHIQSLTIPSTISGVGEYAFNECTSLKTVEFADNIKVLGAGAFEDCTALESVYITENANLDYIEPDTFKNCYNLSSFLVPRKTKAICNSAFEGCRKLYDIDFSYAEILKRIGNDAFKGCFSAINQPTSVVLPAYLEQMGLGVFNDCTQLESVSFPETKITNLYLSNFKGCGENLKHIKIPAQYNETILDDSPGYTYKMFMEEVNEGFYFEGFNDSAMHEITKANQFAFKYMDGDEQYEKIYKEGSNEITYWVNENEELTYVGVKGDDINLKIPGSIGPYDITKISSNFKGNKKIVSVTIPDTIDRIEDEAFKGCNKLTKVIFEEPNNLTYIGTDAFKTQGDTREDGISTGTPSLTFEGRISSSSLPFNYAMDSANQYTNSGQTSDYIIFSSGNPTYLEVKYNPETKKAELIGVPKLDAKHKEHITAAIADSTYTGNADAAIEAYETDASLPPNVEEVVDAAYNITLPTGIQSIKKGLFSDADASSTTETIDNKLNLDDATIHAATDSGVKSNDKIRSIVMHDVEYLDDYTFYGCNDLVSVRMYPSSSSAGEMLGDYAFGYCPNLEEVVLPTTLETMGNRPFVADSNLMGIQFAPETSEDSIPSTSYYGSNFSCENGIIFELDDNNYRDAVVQCLETRGVTSSSSVGPAELEGITKLYDEAFMNCKELGTVDLSSSSLKEIPGYAFANATNLTYAMIPSGCTKINDYAFLNTKLRSITIPNTVSFFDPTAFYDEALEKIINNVEVVTSEGSPAENLAESYKAKYGWKLGTSIQPVFTVTFLDQDNKTVIDEQLVTSGEDAIDPRDKDIKMPEYEGKYFVKWDRDFTNVGRDLYVMAVYDDIPDKTWIVNFYDWDMTLLVSRTVPDGGAAEEPKSPSRENYTFKGWSKAFDKVTADVVNEDGELDVMALYDYNTSGTNGGSNGSGGSTSGNNSNNNSNNNAKTYTVTVVNGSGSGSYVEGATVIVAAYAPNKGYQFHKWTSNDDDVDFASESVAATTFKMPDENVTVTANYITTSESGNTVTNNKNYGTVTSAPSSNKGSTSSKPSSKNDNDGSTSVDVNRPGIKNENLASATVNGSTDNFVVRVSETPEATAAVAQALKNEYGNLDNIRYFAMDINLYDETGKKKITDTEGLTVTITLPLPDELRQYAGNNKVGAVANNKLEKLAAKFTTVADVPCVTFTATHFSPYTIYVDTGNLTEGIADSTPTTGDGIHPKWFLVIGLGCISALLFMKRDKNLDLAVE